VGKEGSKAANGTKSPKKRGAEEVNGGAVKKRGRRERSEG